MANIILYASPHVYSNIVSELTGGIIYEQPTTVNIVPFHSSSHLYWSRSSSVLKGGTQSSPSSLSSLYSNNGFNVPSVSALASGICNDFGVEVEGILGGLKQGQDLLDSPFSSLRDELNNLDGMAATPVDTINTGLDGLSSSATGAVPELPDVDELDRIMQACGLLRGGLLDGVMDPNSLLSGFLDQLLSTLGNIMDGALDALGSVLGIIEAGAAFILNEINKLIKLLGIDKLLAKLDSLLLCVESICGRSFSVPTEIVDADQDLQAPEIPTSEAFYLDYIDDTMKYVDNMLVDMNLDVDGTFNPDNMFAEFKNIPQEVFDNIKTLSTTMGEETDGATDSMVALVDDMKPMMTTLVDNLKNSADSFGSNEEMLATLDDQEEEMKEMITSLEETVDPVEQETLLTQINTTKNAAEEILEPIVKSVSDAGSFFT